MRENLPHFEPGSYFLRAEDLNRLARIAGRADNFLLGPGRNVNWHEDFISTTPAKTQKKQYFVRMLTDAIPENVDEAVTTTVNGSQLGAVPNAINQYWDDFSSDWLDDDQNWFYVTPAFDLPLVNDQKLWIEYHEASDRWVPVYHQTVELVRATSNVPNSDGMLDSFIQVWDSDQKIWSDAQPVWLIDANA